MLGNANAPAGTQVWVAGYPQGDQLSLTTGIIVDYVSGTVYNQPGQIMELTAPIQPGNSGSPLLDSKGHVVGVAFGINPVTGNSLAIPVSSLMSYLSDPSVTTYGYCSS